MIVELSPSMFNERDSEGDYTIHIDTTMTSTDYHRGYCIFLFWLWPRGWTVVVQNRYQLNQEIWPNEASYNMDLREERECTDFIKLLALKFAADVIKQDPLIEDVIIKI